MVRGTENGAPRDRIRSPRHQTWLPGVSEPLLPRGTKISAPEPKSVAQGFGSGAEAGHKNTVPGGVIEMVAEPGHPKPGAWEPPKLGAAQPPFAVLRWTNNYLA